MKVAIIGSGPLGLESALHLLSLGAEVALFSDGKRVDNKFPTFAFSSKAFFSASSFFLCCCAQAMKQFMGRGMCFFFTVGGILILIIKMQDKLLNNDAQEYTIPRWSDLQGIYVHFTQNASLFLTGI